MKKALQTRVQTPTNKIEKNQSSHPKQIINQANTELNMSLSSDSDNETMPVNPNINSTVPRPDSTQTNETRLSDSSSNNSSDSSDSDSSSETTSTAKNTPVAVSNYPAINIPDVGALDMLKTTIDDDLRLSESEESGSDTNSSTPN